MPFSGLGPLTSQLYAMLDFLSPLTAQVWVARFSFLSSGTKAAMGCTTLTILRELTVHLLETLYNACYQTARISDHQEMDGVGSRQDEQANGTIRLTRRFIEADRKARSRQRERRLWPVSNTTTPETIDCL